MSSFDQELDSASALVVAQRIELGEFFGFETRNKYEIRSVSGGLIGFAAEQQKGIVGFLLRQFLGHLRTFDVVIFDGQRNTVLVAHHPFRWFFQCLEVMTYGGQSLGRIERRWSWVSKRFDVLDRYGHLLLTVDSPLWRPWTFSFRRLGSVVATIKKRWSGGFAEVFTDADSFFIDYQPGPVNQAERRLLLAAAIFVDLMYFERKAG